MDEFRSTHILASLKVVEMLNRMQAENMLPHWKRNAFRVVIDEILKGVEREIISEIHKGDVNGIPF